MGPNSGEQFRDLLAKTLKRYPNETIEVLLDGAEGFGSSFLEEAFGGLIRHKIITIDQARARLRVVGVEPKFKTYAAEAIKYMEEEAARGSNGQRN